MDDHGLPRSEPLEAHRSPSTDGGTEKRQEGREPATATRSWEGKPLKVKEPQGCYQGRSLEGSEPEQAVEAVRNGTGGT
jgi:hypothetical protein